MSESRHPIVALCLLALCISVKCEAQSEEVPAPDPERLEQRVYEYHSAILSRDLERAYAIWAPEMRVLPLAEWEKQYKDAPTGRLEELKVKETSCETGEHRVLSIPVVACNVTVWLRVVVEGGLEPESGDAHEAWVYVQGEWYFYWFYHH